MGRAFDKEDSIYFKYEKFKVLFFDGTWGKIRHWYGWPDMGNVKWGVASLFRMLSHITI